MTSRSARPVAALAAALALILSPLTASDASAVPAVSGAERAAAVKPKAGTYEGTIGKKGDQHFFSLDVKKQDGRFRVKGTVAFYECDGNAGYTRFPKMTVAQGHYSQDGLVHLQGAFPQRKLATGRAKPSPGFFGCTTPWLPFTATYVGKRVVVKAGTYQGTDAAGSAVELTVDKGGKVAKDLTVTRNLDCDGGNYGGLSQFESSGIHADGSAGATIVDDFAPVTFTYAVAATDEGTITGSYRASGPACDTGAVAFTLAR